MYIKKKDRFERKIDIMLNFKTKNKIWKGEIVRFENKGTLVKINLSDEIGIDVIYTKFTLNLVSHILKFRKVNDDLLWASEQWTICEVDKIFWRMLCIPQWNILIIFDDML
jgi:hypothetical protein